MLIGPHSSQQEQDAMAERIKSEPRNYIAQPTLSISTAPTLYDAQSSNDEPETVVTTVEARHVDLRPFVLQGSELSVTTGGLTRVALVPGSLVVNSSQGGGSKDTWVVDHGPSAVNQHQRYDTAEAGSASGSVSQSQSQAQE
jgi:uncharacterized circularly permuted ATP-grasp superfamily protein